MLEKGGQTCRPSSSRQMLAFQPAREGQQGRGHRQRHRPLSNGAGSGQAADGLDLQARMRSTFDNAPLGVPAV